MALKITGTAAMLYIFDALSQPKLILSPFRVKGGTQQISEKLAEKIQQHGGKVELNYEVRFVADAGWSGDLTSSHNNWSE